MSCESIGQAGRVLAPGVNGQRRRVGGHMTTRRFRCGCFIFVLLAGVSPSMLLAQTSGLIDTKPQCWPGALHAADSYLNQYVEGPDAIRLDNGDIVILVNNGAPEAPDGAEAIMALRYLADGS